MKVFKNIESLIGFGVGCATALIWIYGTFATIKYVDQKHEVAVAHADSKFERNDALLREIRELVKTIEARMWDSRPGVVPAQRQGRSQ